MSLFVWLIERPSHSPFSILPTDPVTRCSDLFYLLLPLDIRRVGRAKIDQKAAACVSSDSGGFLSEWQRAHLSSVLTSENCAIYRLISLRRAIPMPAIRPPGLARYGAESEIFSFRDQDQRAECRQILGQCFHCTEPPWPGTTHKPINQAAHKGRLHYTCARALLHWRIGDVVSAPMGAIQSTDKT